MILKSFILLVRENVAINIAIFDMITLDVACIVKTIPGNLDFIYFPNLQNLDDENKCDCTECDKTYATANYIGIILK